MSIIIIIIIIEFKVWFTIYLYYWNFFWTYNITQIIVWNLILTIRSYCTTCCNLFVFINIFWITYVYTCWIRCNITYETSYICYRWWIISIYRYCYTTIINIYCRCITYLCYHTSYSCLTYKSLVIYCYIDYISCSLFNFWFYCCNIITIIWRCWSIS